MLAIAGDPGGSAPPSGIVLGAAFGGCLGWAFVARTSGLDASLAAAGFVVISLILSWWVAPLTALAVAAVGAVSVDAFVLSAHGRLEVSPMLLGAFALLATTCAAAAAAGSRRRRRQGGVKRSIRPVKGP